MRRIFVFLFIIVTAYALYHDLKVGSLPEKKIAETTEVFQDSQYYIQKVSPGDTVIGIIEKNEQSLPVSIEQIIADFKELNNGLEPEQIKIGQSYKFKRYHQVPK